MPALGIRYREQGEALLLQGLDGSRLHHPGGAGAAHVPQEQHVGHLDAGPSPHAAAAAGLAAPVGSDALPEDVRAACNSDRPAAESGNEYSFR